MLRPKPRPTYYLFLNKEELVFSLYTHRVEWHYHYMALIFFALSYIVVLYDLMFISFVGYFAPHGHIQICLLTSTS